MGERSVWEDIEDRELISDFVGLIEEKGPARVAYGRPPEEHPMACDEMLSFAVPEDMRSAVTAAARQAGMSRSAWLRGLVVSYFTNLPEYEDEDDDG